TVAELKALEAQVTPISGPPRERRHEQVEYEYDKQQDKPGEAAVSHWPADADAATAESTSSHVAFNIPTNWRGPKVSESGFIPPDSNGAVGPTQALVTANGRFKLD